MEKNKKMPSSKDRALQLANYIGIGVFAGFFFFFWCNGSFYHQATAADGGNETGLLLGRILFITILTVFGVILLLWKNGLTGMQNKIASVLLFILTPVVSFFSLEYANIGISRLFWQVLQEFGIRKVLVSMAVLYLLLLLAYVISNSMKAAAIAVSMFTAVFGVVCFFVFAFRGIPFLASDLTIMGTAFNVMAGYDYQIGYEAFVLLYVTVAWCAVFCKLRGEKGLVWKVRIPAAIGILGACSVMVYTFVYTGFLNKHGVGVNNFMPQKSYAKHGSILTFIRSIQYIMVEKPEGYQIAAAGKIAKEYGEAGVSEKGIKPNVMIIMDEAFADLQAIGGFETSEEVTPFFHSLKENTVRGDMYVSVFGGKTANTEFEVLTGNSVAFLPASSTPYQLFIKEKLPSLAYTLKAQGYQGNIAMHPYRPNGYNRMKVYPLLGFDRFLDRDHFQDPKLVRKFISDDADFERIILEYEQAKARSDAPFFLFNVTMQNHSGYDEDYDNFPIHIKITDEAFQDDQAERYLNLLHLSDQALEQLIHYFEKVEEPTVVVFFGDHQPGLPNKFYKKLLEPAGKTGDEKQMEKYKVPYIIWANYDIEEREDVTISANYLSTLMMQSTGMDMTGYSRFQAEASKEIPVLTVNGYYGADGTFYKVRDKKSPYYKTLQKYSCLQYNNMFDKGNRVEGFFE